VTTETNGQRVAVEAFSRITRVRIWLLGRLDVLLISVGSAAYGLYVWSIYPYRPGVWQPLGYQSWADQSSYLTELRYLAHFSLPATPEEYLRGLGYPLVGVPFYWLGFRVDPLLPANLIMLGIVVGASFVLAKRLTHSTVISYALVGILVVASPLVELVIVPWSTTATLTAMAVALLIATSPRGVTNRGAFWLGMMAGWSFAARYLDVLAVGAVCIWYLVAGGRAGFLRRFLAMAIPALTWLVLAALSQLVVHHSLFSTGYTLHKGDPQSLGYYSLHRVPRYFWETFVTATGPLGRSEMNPLFVITPILVLLPLGIWLVLRRGSGWGNRGLHLAVILGSLIQGTIYLAGFFGGADALHYRSPRFWIASYPYWLILSLIAGLWIYRAVRRVRDRNSALSERPGDRDGDQDHDETPDGHDPRGAAVHP
jgi:hypothetical protein